MPFAACSRPQCGIISLCQGGHPARGQDGADPEFPILPSAPPRLVSKYGIFPYLPTPRGATSVVTLECWARRRRYGLSHIDLVGFEIAA